MPCQSYLKDTQIPITQFIFLYHKRFLSFLQPFCPNDPVDSSELRWSVRFDYKLYKSYRTEEKSENLKFTYLFQSSRTSELINRAELPEKLKGFLDFSADQKEIKSLILHGTEDSNHHLYHITEFLEVRLYEGEDIISYIYSPNKKPEQDEYNEMIELESGW